MKTKIKSLEQKIKDLNLAYTETEDMAKKEDIRIELRLIKFQIREAKTDLRLAGG